MPKARSRASLQVLKADDAVYLDETVATDGDARLEVSLDDQTVLTVGERRLSASTILSTSRTKAW